MVIRKQRKMMAILKYLHGHPYLSIFQIPLIWSNEMESVYFPDIFFFCYVFYFCDKYECFRRRLKLICIWILCSGLGLCLCHFIILFNCIRMDSQNMASLPRLTSCTQRPLLNDGIIHYVMQFLISINWHQSEWSASIHFNEKPKEKCVSFHCPWE